jgi:GntR family transcriptional regulator / MocR family aminotransferase
MLGGLPDPALFPRAQWLRHYRAALAALPDPGLTYPDTRGASQLRAALTAYLGRVRGVTTEPRRILVCAGSPRASRSPAARCAATARAGSRSRTRASRPTARRSR